jgi:hypothetical protein
MDGVYDGGRGDGNFVQRDCFANGAVVGDLPNQDYFSKLKKYSIVNYSLFIITNQASNPNSVT